MSNSNKIFNLLLLSILFISISYPIDALAVEPDSHLEFNIDKINNPVANQKPQSLLQFDVQKPAEIAVRVVVVYSATSETCRTRTLGTIFEGAPLAYPKIFDEYEIPQGKETGALIIPFDKYLPGECNWVARAVSTLEYIPGVDKVPHGFAGGWMLSESGETSTDASYVCSPFRQKHGYGPTLICSGIGSQVSLQISGAKVSAKIKIAE